MPLPNLPWNTVTPTNQDTIETVGSNQPDLTNDSTPGANDGHRVLVEHVHALRNKLQNAYLEIGTNPGNEPTSSIRYRLASLEASAGTDEKTKIRSSDTTQGYLNDKIAAGTGIAKTILNPAGNEQLELSVSGLLAVDFNEEFFETTTEPAGTDVYKVLTNTPNLATVSLSGRALDVYRNGKRMKYDATPTAYDEYNYESGANRIHVKASGLADEYEVVYITGGTPTPSNFLDLGDVPDAYTGQGGKVLKVAGTEDEIVFEAASVGAHASEHQTGGSDLLAHDSIPGSGSNSHSAIDTHLGSTSNPHTVTPAQVGNTTAQWNADQLRGNNVHDSSPTDGQVLTWNNTDSRWEPATPGSGVSNFLALSDTPSAYTGQENKFVRVESASPDELIFADATKSDVGLANVTNDAQLKRADNDWAFTEESTPLITDILLLEKATGGLKRNVQAGNLKTNAVKLQGNNVHDSSPTDGQVLTWNNTETRWEAQTPSGGGGGDTPHEEVWTSAASGSPGVITLKNDTVLNATPRGGGTADTPSGYDIRVYCEGVMMKHVAGTPAATNEYKYQSGTNKVDVYGSGEADFYQIVYGS